MSVDTLTKHFQLLNIFIIVLSMLESRNTSYVKTLTVLKVAFATICTSSTYLMCSVELYSELCHHLMKYFCWGFKCGSFKGTLKKLKPFSKQTDLLVQL